MMKKSTVIKVLFTFLLMFCGLPMLFAANLQDLLNSSQIDQLKAGEHPAQVQFKNNDLLLVPNNVTLKRMIDTIRTDLNPSVIAEELFLYQKPAHTDGSDWTSAELAALYNQSVSLSTLAGIQYYSASRSAMRTFYETSSVIDDPAAKNLLPDPVFAMPRIELTLYARQKDLTFGDNIYQYTYRSYPGALVFIQENLTDMKAGIFTAVKKNNLHSVLAMLDAGDQILIYAVSMAKASSVPGMNDRIGSSFTNRAEAIIKWVTSRADIAFGKNP
ncbi:MAG: hypothetical protein FWD78_01660 [Treponema sp.]|nr:hypothetical protein [Treponema sp.]